MKGLSAENNAQVVESICERMNDPSPVRNDRIFSLKKNLYPLACSTCFVTFTLSSK